jgi:hypothetical protein
MKTKCIRHPHTWSKKVMIFVTLFKRPELMEAKHRGPSRHTDEDDRWKLEWVLKTTTEMKMCEQRLPRSKLSRTRLNRCWSKNQHQTRINQDVGGDPVLSSRTREDSRYHDVDATRVIKSVESRLIKSPLRPCHKISMLPQKLSLKCYTTRKWIRH